MARKLSDIQLRELGRKKQWCLTSIDFMVTKYGQNAVYQELVSAVMSTYADNGLRGMRSVFRDLNEWARGLSPMHVRELNMLLKEKFGEDLQNESGKDLVKIAQIRKRGKIRTENEFRLVQERTEEIWNDDDKKKEVESLNKLLADFEHS